VRNAYWVKRSRRAFRSTPPLNAAADDFAADAFAAPFTVEVSNAKVMTAAANASELTSRAVRLTLPVSRFRYESSSAS